MKAYFIPEKLALEFLTLAFANFSYEGLLREPREDLNVGAQGRREVEIALLRVEAAVVFYVDYSVFFLKRNFVFFLLVVMLLVLSML